MILRLLSFSFALLILVTSQSMAVARGQAAVADEMIICNGNGTMTVLFDAEGNPIETPHICPDCTATLMLALPDYAPAQTETTFRLQRFDILRSGDADLIPRFDVYARGPPA